MKKLLFLLFLLPSLVMAQHTCGADEYNQPFINNNPQHYQEIEERLQDYIEKRNNKSIYSILRPSYYSYSCSCSME